MLSQACVLFILIILHGSFKLHLGSVITKDHCSCIYTMYCIHTQVSCTITHLQDGWTPLFIACHEGHVSVVEHLIATKADINHQDEVNPVLYISTKMAS